MDRAFTVLKITKKMLETRSYRENVWKYLKQRMKYLKAENELPWNREWICTKYLNIGNSKIKNCEIFEVEERAETLDPERTKEKRSTTKVFLQSSRCLILNQQSAKYIDEYLNVLFVSSLPPHALRFNTLRWIKPEGVNRRFQTLIW